MQINRMFLAILILLSAACGPLADIREMVEPDLTPPLLLGARTLNEGQIELEFDEAVCCQADSVRFVPELEVVDILNHAERIIIRVAGQIPGQEYLLEATVSDEYGNSLSFMATFYGFNPEVPEIVINEFTTRGSGNHPDVVELKVMGAGNMAGVCLYQGTPGNCQDRLVFPRFNVQEGDFILVHFKPEGIPAEIDETEAKDISGGLDASDQAYDFWIREGRGISGNNGVLTVYDRPAGLILDGVLYSNRRSDSDERYRGFGTRNTLERAEELVRDMGWLTAEDQVRPEDGVNPEGSAGTRSICRDSRSTDTDSKADWHIVPTRGYSFGADNSDEIYK